MKEIKRILSLILCFVMVVGLMPAFAVNASAVEEAGDDASIGSDVNDAAGNAEETLALSEGLTTLAEDGWTPTTAEGEWEVPVTVKKTVYKLATQLSSGTSYLIVNSNTAGDRFALANDGGNAQAVPVTVKSDSNGTYIELEDAANVLWTAARAAGSYGSSTYTFANGGYSVYSDDNELALSEENSTSWSYSSSRLSYSVGSSYNRTTYYLRYNNGWEISSSNNNNNRNVYFYAPAEIDVPSTAMVKGVFAIAGDPASVRKVVVGGETVELGSVLTFTYGDNQVLELDSSAAAFEVVDGFDVADVDGNTLTFTGMTGTAVVQVSYDIPDVGEVVNFIAVEAAAPSYKAEITKDGEVVETIGVKGVNAATTLELGYTVTYEDADGDHPVEGGSAEWSIPAEYARFASIDEDGVITFTGAEGRFVVELFYTAADGQQVYDTVTINASATEYIVPEDGTNDFPEYPNEGAVRFDKNATAVGNFSESGMAKVELSMTGVPYSTNNEIDVVIMVDMSTSMNKTASTNGIADRVQPAKDAVIAALNAIVKNEDGSFNKSRVAIYTFSGSLNPNSNGSCDLQTFDANSLASMTTKINSWKADGGTNY